MTLLDNTFIISLWGAEYNSKGFNEMLCTRSQVLYNGGAYFSGDS